MTRILLNVDEPFFEKMKVDKIRREGILRYKLTWEEYVKLLFGFSKRCIIQ